jgi:DNA polymerase-3 subunit epsilon
VIGPAVIGVPVAADAVARALGRHHDYRVLRRMQPMDRRGVVQGRSRPLIGCALDVETTGLDHREDAIIELAMQRFWADENGRIVVTGRPHGWLEDPGRSIDPEITRLTGLADPDVAGRSIFDPIATSMLIDSDFVVAHNAGFDRPFVERRLPAAVGGRWACSMRDLPWREHGFEGRTLSHLLGQMGWFYDAHRAPTDVTALLHLLDHPLDTGGTVLKALLANASRPTWLVEAVGAPFSAKSLLRMRGYRWNAEARLWSREVGQEAFDAEIEWATLEIYGGMSKPRFRQMTWEQRYAAS